MNRLIVVEGKVELEAVKATLGFDTLVVSTDGPLRSATYTEAGLVWSESAAAWLELLRQYRGLVDEVVIATERGARGELIGAHAMEDASAELSGSEPSGNKLVFKRAWIESLRRSSVERSLELADDRFDEKALGSALLMAYASAKDAAEYASCGLPLNDYRPAEVRMAVYSLNEQAKVLSDEDGAPLKQVWCKLSAPDGNEYVAFVPVSSSTLSKPYLMDWKRARTIAKRLEAKPELRVYAAGKMGQVGTRYPENTTARVVGAAMDALDLELDEILDVLKSLYEHGLMTKGDGPFLWPRKESEAGK